MSNMKSEQSPQPHIKSEDSRSQQPNIKLDDLPQPETNSEHVHRSSPPKYLQPPRWSADRAEGKRHATHSSVGSISSVGSQSRYKKRIRHGTPSDTTEDHADKLEAIRNLIRKPQNARNPYPVTITWEWNIDGPSLLGHGVSREIMDMLRDKLVPEYLEWKQILVAHGKPSQTHLQTCEEVLKGFWETLPQSKQSPPITGTEFGEHPNTVCTPWNWSSVISCAILNDQTENRREDDRKFDRKLKDVERGVKRLQLRKTTEPDEEALAHEYESPGFEPENDFELPPIEDLAEQPVLATVHLQEASFQYNLKDKMATFKAWPQDEFGVECLVRLVQELVFLTATFSHLGDNISLPWCDLSAVESSKADSENHDFSIRLRDGIHEIEGGPIWLNILEKADRRVVRNNVVQGFLAPENRIEGLLAGIATIQKILPWFKPWDRNSSAQSLPDPTDRVFLDASGTAALLPTKILFEGTTSICELYYVSATPATEIQEEIAKIYEALGDRPHFRADEEFPRVDMVRVISAEAIGTLD